MLLAPICNANMSREERISACTDAFRAFCNHGPAGTILHCKLTHGFRLNSERFNAWVGNVPEETIELFKTDADLLRSALTYENFWRVSTTSS